METTYTYALILSDDITDVMIKHNKIKSNLDTMFMVSDEYYFLEDVKEYLENMSKSGDIIKTLTGDYADKEVWDELFRVIEITSYTPMSEITKEAFENIPENVICIEGIVNATLEGDLEGIQVYHNRYFDFNELHGLREHFGYEVI
jgi:predicted nuclease with TOPRIM domain